MTGPPTGRSRPIGREVRRNLTEVHRSYRIGDPEIDRAMTRRWISEVPSKIV